MSNASLDQAGGLWNGGTRPYAVNSKKLGMWLFIVSDAITFATLIVSYGYVRLANNETGWPKPFDAGSIVFSSIMTFCLLSSSLTMVMAVSAGHRGDRKAASNWIFATMLGGLAFVVLHGIEWSHLIHSGITPVSFEHHGQVGPPMFGGTFFACTGMHMLHVVTGVGYLAVVALGFRKGKFTGEDVEVAGLYWHFVDLVWMFIFPLVYLMSVKIG